MTEQNRRADDKRAPGKLQWGDAAAPAYEQFSYSITPRSAHVGGGWRLQLLEGGKEVGGGVYPVNEDVTSGDAHQEAMDDGEAWLMSRGAPADQARAAAPTKLTDEDITVIWQTMPGGPAGWLKSFGFLQFARAVEEQVLDNNVSPAAPASADNPSTAGAVTDAMVEAARNAFDGFPCPMNGSAARGISKEQMRAGLEAAFCLAAPVAQSTAGAAKPTALSHRLRETADQQPGWKPLLTAAADEIERYYGGMLAWKQTAEKKDRDWQAERMGRVDDRIAARLAAPAAQAPIPEILFDGHAVYAEITRHLGKSHCHRAATVTETLEAVVRLLRTASKDQSSALGEKGGDDV